MKKNTLWIGVLASLVFFTLLVGYLVVATKINNAVEAVPTSTPPGSLQQTAKVNNGYEVTEVTLTIDLPPEISSPRVEVFGTMVDRICYSPFDPACLRDYSAQVSGGRLTAKFTVPINAQLHFGYRVNSQFYTDNTSINGVAMTGACLLNPTDKNGSWPVISFKVEQVDKNLLAIFQNPNCQQKFERYEVILQEQGDVSPE